MEFALTEENGIAFVEAQPGQPFMSKVEDVNRIIEACLSNGVGSVLLYPDNLTASFFDLSSREAGEILQKLRTYHIRLAIVCPPGSVRLSSRFADLLAEERQGGYVKVVETRDAARAWLTAAR